jgi:nitrate/nitrite-specific signal transduction histidine kinase
MKHAKPKEVVVTLVSTGHDTMLTIEDDGTGLPEDEEKLQAGSGLRIMKYRAAALGARLKFAKRSPSGTIVTCVLPVRSPGSAA